MTSSGCSVATATPTSPCAELEPDAAVAIRDSRPSSADAQLAAPLVEQVDRKRFERNQPADQPRNLLQQIVEIEHGRDLAAQVEERGDELVLGRLAGSLGVGVRRGFVGWKCLAHVRRVLPSAIRDPRNTDYTCKFSAVRQTPARCGRAIECMDITLPLDYAAIERILPHRYPFLLVDRITEFEPDKRIVGIKNVTLNERYLAHQPGGAPGAAADDPDRSGRAGRRDHDPGEAGEPREADLLHGHRARALSAARASRRSWS